MLLTLNEVPSNYYRGYDKGVLGICFGSNKCLLVSTKPIENQHLMLVGLCVARLLLPNIGLIKPFCPFTDLLLSKSSIALSKESACLAITYYAKSAYINANGTLRLQFLEHENYALPLLNEYQVESESLQPYQMRDTGDLIPITLREAISVVQGEKQAFIIRKSKQKRNEKGKRKIDNVPQTKQA